MLSYRDIGISWLGHAAFRIKGGSKTVYFDPFKIGKGEAGDIIMVSHEHFDHLSIDDLRKVVGPSSVIVSPPSCRDQILRLKAKEVKIVRAGDALDIEGVGIRAVPAYNLNKFREPGRVFHPREEGKVGYIATIAGVKVYHAGDTDHISEMKGLDVDIALLPVSGTYVMTAEEAAEAVSSIKPRLAIPMHYGEIAGSEKDAERFRRLASCKVEILKRE